MRKLTTLFVILILVGLSACSTQRETAESASTEPVRGGTLRLAISSDPSTLNPARYGNTAAAQVFALLQPSLMKFNAEHRWEPSLAGAWSWEDDRTLVIELDSRLRWSDGTPFTARDIVATYELYADTTVGYANAQALDVLESTEIIDPGHLRVRLAARGSEPLLALQHDILPAHVIETFDRSDPPSWSIGRVPVTLGPYRLADWQPQERLLLERNPHHPDPGYVDRIEVFVVPEKTTQLLRLQIGEVDVVEDIGPGQVERLQDNSELQLEGIAPRSIAFLLFNFEDPLISDLRVREAIALAIDRATICEGIFFGFALPGTSVLPPVNWAYDASLPPLPYDPDRARDLLDEVGIKDTDADGVLEFDGRPLRLRALAQAGDPAREAMVSLVSAQLRKVGVELDLQVLERSAWQKKTAEGDFQISFAQMGGLSGPDVSPILGTGADYNFSHYSSSRLDELCVEVNAEPDRTRAREIAAEIQRTVAEDLPVAILYYPQKVVGLRARVRGATPTWRSPFDGFERWWLADAAPAGGR